MRKLLFLFFAMIFLGSNSFGQELNCKVTVNAQKLNVNDAKVMKTLEQSLNEFMNNTKWTNDNFKPFERIECSILLTIDSKNGDKCTGNLTIQSSRPVYNSDYKTTILNWKDRNFNFVYKEFDPIEFSENSFTSNLASTFAFYADVIIGLDYDSYALNGGTPFYNKAENIVNQVPLGEPGWSPDSKDLNDRTRGNMVTEFQNPKFKAFRDAMYSYHLKGLDKMFDDPSAGKAGILAASTSMASIIKDNPNAMVVQLFNLAKSSETSNFTDAGGNNNGGQGNKPAGSLDQNNTQKNPQQSIPNPENLQKDPGGKQ